ncbi:8-amino-7-oxononanoate synthase [Apiospora arundinis]
MDGLPQGQRPTFLDLPREIRDKIYEALFVQPEEIDCHLVWFSTPARHRRQLAREGVAPDCCGHRAYGCATHFEARLRPHGTALLRTCRQIHDEGTETLYERNVFLVALEQRCVFLRLFGIGERNLRLVRHVKLMAWTDYHAYYIIPDSERGSDQWTAKPWEFFGGVHPIGDDVSRAAGWAALVGGLKKLEIIPLVPNWGHHRAWPVWVCQLEPILKIIGDAVSEETEVIVDDNRSIFLCDAVDRCFSRTGFRRARLLEGDGHFIHGRYDPNDVNDVAPRNCDGEPVPEEILKLLPSHPTEPLPFVLFGEDDSQR